MRYAMMKRTTNWIPPVRHKRSQNAGVAYTLVDDVPRVVDVLMRFSSLTESEFESPLRVLTHQTTRSRSNPLDDGIGERTFDARPCRIAVNPVRSTPAPVSYRTDKSASSRLS